MVARSSSSFSASAGFVGSMPRLVMYPAHAGEAAVVAARAAADASELRRARRGRSAEQSGDVATRGVERVLCAGAAVNADAIGSALRTREVRPMPKSADCVFRSCWDVER